MSPPALEDLPRDEAHLWHVDPEAIRDPRVLASFRELLCEEEAARQRRFRFARGRQEALVTRALVRTRLSRYTGVEPARWRFAAGPHGRPEISTPASWRELRFNLSHTHGCAVCLVAWGVDVGVDVEDVTRPGCFLDIAHRYFSAPETDALFSLPAAERTSRFFDYWTLKEAYIKARGMGLAIPLAQFSFAIESGAPVGIRFAPELADDPSAWQFQLLELGPRHRAAVAIRAGAFRLKLRVREFEP